MQEEKGKGKKTTKPNHTHEQKVEKAKLICDLYAKGEHTIAQCVEYYGIAERTFREWVSENADIAEIYGDCKKRINDEYLERLRKKSRSVIESYLESEEVEKTEQIFATKTVTNKEGETKTVKFLKEERIIKYVRKPSERMAQYVAEKLIPEFAAKQEITHNINKGVIILPAEKETPQEQPISIDELLNDAS